MIESATRDRAAVAEAHDALWAALWNRRYDDVDEAVWVPAAVHRGMLAFVRTFPEGASLAAIDTGDAFVVFRDLAPLPPVGSRLRVLPGMPGEWKVGDGAVPFGPGLSLRFDRPPTEGEAEWIGPTREALAALRAGLEGRQRRLAARRSELGAVTAPATLETIWRAEVAAIGERAQLETDYTAAEREALTRAQAKGPRFGADEEQRIVAARGGRYAARTAEEVARFRNERWPAIAEAAGAEGRKYAEYRSEVVRLEDGLQGIRVLQERVQKAESALDAIARAGFAVEGAPPAGEELLRSVELLVAAIPQRAPNGAARFSAYRSPTAGPSVIPPRV